MRLLKVDEKDRWLTEKMWKMLLDRTDVSLAEEKYKNILSIESPCICEEIKAGKLGRCNYCPLGSCSKLFRLLGEFPEDKKFKYSLHFYCIRFHRDYLPNIQKIHDKLLALPKIKRRK